MKLTEFLMPYKMLDGNELEDLNNEQAKVARELDRLMESIVAQVNTGYSRARGWRAAQTVFSPLSASLAGAAGLTGISGIVGPAVAGGIALAAAVVAATEGALSPATRSTKARDDAESFIALRDRVRQFVYLRLITLSAIEAADQAEAFTARMHEISEKADPPGLLMWRRIRRGS